MTSNARPRILLATAGFGEGHNSAAKNLDHALGQESNTLVTDPCAQGAPLLNRSLRSAYRFVTTHWPSLWAHCYRGVEKRDFSKRQFPFMRKAEDALRATIAEFKPDVMVSTYPLYPYFMNRARAELQHDAPIVTVVTDSIAINAAWRNAPTDYWLVTDRFTRERLMHSGIDQKKIIESGFPVSPTFADLEPLPAEDPLDSFRILFFPTAKQPTVRRVIHALLDNTDPRTCVTIVLGRNVRRLYHKAREMKMAYPERVRIMGWTRKVPELLCTHHLVVGKAGGATVHEALAAATPMLIHHLVPGQEEGNLELLTRYGGGALAESHPAQSTAVRDLLADNGARWRQQKRNLLRHARPRASLVAARFILDQAGSPQPHGADPAAAAPETNLTP